MLKTHIFDKRIRRYAVLSLILFLLIQLLGLLSPFVMKQIVDQFIPDGNAKYIILATVLMVFIPFVVVITNTIYNYLSIKFARNKGNEIAIQLIDNVLHQNYEYFLKQNSMELVGYLSKEAVSYVAFYIRELPRYIGYIIVSIITFIVLVYYNPVIALFQLIYIPVSMIPIRYITKTIESEVKTIVTKNAKLLQIRSDMIRGIEYIKLNNLENTKINEIRSENNEIVKTWGKVAALDSLTGFWSVGFTTVLFAGLTFGISALLFIQNSSFSVRSIGELILLYSYATIFYSYINNAIKTHVDRKKQEAEFAKLTEFFELDFNDGDSTVSQISSFNNLELINLEFAYHDKKVLSNLSFTLNHGEWLGLQGDSGAGKTTILNLVMKLYTPNSGAIMVNGIDSAKISSHALREIFTKISQDIFLFPGTIYDNFKLVNSELSESDMMFYLRISELHDFVEALPDKIYTEVGELGKLISGGEKQRLSLAIGLSRNSDVILLDEVTANLDADVELKIVNNLELWRKENYKTILSVSHRHNFHKTCNRVISI